ncbi:PGF-pre-PGF domain-containing protein, partial [Candidatus Woesearchaeota archaeon]|nr:PGF-pre-PGF domain-containing protein [Candidatus Woesearchaeota archaeon]
VDGNHTLIIFSNDTAGNVNRTQTLSFIFDHVAPTVYLVNSSYSVANNTPLIVFNFTDNVDDIVNCTIYNSSNNKLAVNISIFNNGTTTNAKFNTLSDGTYYNVSVNCTDDTRLIGRSNSINITIDITAPSLSSLGSSGVTDSAASLSVTTSEAATCRYAGGSNSGYSAMTSFSTTGATSHSTSLTGLSAGTGYTYYVRCQDSLANEGSGSTAFTTSAAPSGGGGSGGAGGGVPVTVPGTFAKEVWTSINSGETATVVVANGAIGVTEVSFAVDKTTYGAWVKVERIDSLPATISSFGGQVYKNVKITESNIEKVLKDDKATIDFKVEKTWLAEKKLNKEQVAMFRSVDNRWTELKTTFGEDDGTYVHYSAITPGFSYFVIGSKSGTMVVAAPGITKEEAVPKLGETAPAAGEEVVVDEAGEDVVGGAKKMNFF